LYSTPVAAVSSLLVVQRNGTDNMYVASDDNIVMQNASDISMQIIALQKKNFLYFVPPT
jgi:hypothetical protein